MLIGDVIFYICRQDKKLIFTLLNAKQLCNKVDDVTIVIICQRASLVQVST